MLANPAWPPTATSTTVSSREAPVPSGSAAVTVTRRNPASSPTVVCAPGAFGSASTDNATRPAAESASANVTVVDPEATTAAPPCPVADIVIVSSDSSNPSAVPDKVNEPLALTTPAGRTNSKSATTS